MKIFENVYDMSKINKCVLAFGNFDGVHDGHKHLLLQAKKYAEERGLLFGVYTFADSPKFSGADHSILTTLKMRLSLLEDVASPDFVYLESFGSVKHYSPEEFAKYIIDKFSCECGFCGENFRFGKNASGSSETLAKLMSEHKKSAVVVPSFLNDGAVVSSSLICSLLKIGDVEKVRMLGYTFGFVSTVEHGANLGNKLGFPTINQVIPDELVYPSYGVYATLVTVDGKEYTGVTNFGVKPTVSDANIPVAETYIIDFDEDVYGKSVCLQFIKKIRDEKLFSSIEELKQNISENVLQTKMYFEENYEKH